MNPLENYKKFKNIPVPNCMENLDKDRRGFPIPANVYRDPKTGDAMFKVNDVELEKDLIDNQVCYISKKPLTEDNIRFIGSPLSSMPDHLRRVTDGPICLDAALYALKVCPYMALSEYYKGYNPEKVKALNENGDGSTFIDPTQTTLQPPYFVLMHPRMVQVKFDPKIGYLFYIIGANSPDRFFRFGEEIDTTEAAKLLKSYLETPEIKELIRNSQNG